MYGRLHLCVIVLNLVFLDGIPLINQAKIDAILADIRMLLTILPSNGDKLYTPKNIEYLFKINCERMAIKCFMKEVEVLEEENQDNKSITDIIRQIQKNIHAIWREDLQNINQKNTCPRCEMYEVQHSKVFLKHLIEFLQFVYSTRF